MENKLFTALIYVCTRCENDFITPLVKIYSVYKESLLLEKCDAKTLGFKCLWYIRFTLSGELFPNEQILEEIYEKVVRQLVVWLFVEEIIESFLMLDARSAYKIFLILFNGRPLSVLCKKNKDLNNYFSVGKNEEVDVLVKMYEVIKNSSKKVEKNKDQFFCFLANIETPQDIKLNFNESLEAAQFFLENPDKLLILNPKKTKGKELLSLLLPFEKELKGMDLSEIVYLVENVKFYEVQVFLFKLNEQYHKCIDVYLDSGLLNPKEAFVLLEDVLMKKKKDEANLIFEHFLKRLNDFVSLDCEKTKQILHRFNLSEKLAVKALTQYPDLQLELLEKIFTNRVVEDKELLLIFLELLCVFKPNRVMGEIKNRTFPLDSSLKICKEKNIKEPTAYLLERAGAVKEAVAMHVNILKDRTEIILRRIEKGKLWDKNWLKICAKNGVNVCKNAHNEDVWFELLDKLLELHTSCIANRINLEIFNKLVTTYNEIIADTIAEISNNVSMKFLILQIQERYGHLGLNSIKFSLMGLLANYHYEQNILKKAKLLVVNDIVYKSIHLFVELSRGRHFQAFCINCETEITEFTTCKYIFFYCGHASHLQCASLQNGCKTCLNNKKTQFAQVINSTLTTKYKKIEFRNEIKEEIKEYVEKIDFSQIKLEIKEKNLRKLKMFDYLSEEKQTQWNIFYEKYEIL